MSKKERIYRLEAKVQEIIRDRSQIRICRMYSSSPSEEEKKIALNKLKELNGGSSEGEIHFIPYKFIDDFRCYFPKSAKNIEWDHDLGVDRIRGIVYKLVEKYSEERILTESDVQIIICSTLVEEYNENWAFTESNCQLFFRIA